MDSKERAIRGEILKADFELFMRYFFKHMNNYKFILNHHHKKIFEVLTRVYEGEIKRLIINLPPGYSKTLLAVQYFIPWVLAKDPSCRFMHLSYSDDLVLSNSSVARDIVNSQEFNALFNVALDPGSKAKGRWDTNQGGYLYAAPSGGAITGFRAGRMDKSKFTGALIIDDPLKPDDAFSDVKRNFINGRFNNTFKSRLAHEGVPIILIMQRVHEDDMSNLLLNGGSGEKWHHLNLQIVFDGIKQYPFSIPIEYKYDGPLWEYKHNLEQIDILRKADSYTFNSQYMQDPASLQDGIYKPEYFKVVAPNRMDFEHVSVFADTAMKTGQHNDYSVFQLWGKYQGYIYLIEQWRGKWEAPDLLIKAQEVLQFARSLESTLTKFRGFYIEDKASGTGLIQQLGRANNLKAKPLKPNKDKLSRAMDAIPYMEQGKVHIFDKAWISEYIAEFLKFKADDTHMHDDQVDTTNYAVSELFASRGKARFI